MREDLVGYLLGAIERPEAEQIEAALADPVSGPDLRRNLDILKSAVAPLVVDRDPWTAPPGLASRTLRLTTGRAGRESPATAGAGSVQATRSPPAQTNPRDQAPVSPAPRGRAGWTEDRGGGEIGRAHV